MKRSSRTLRLKDALSYVSAVSAALHVACSKLDKEPLLRLILDIMVDALGMPIETAALFVKSDDRFALEAWRGRGKPPDSPPETIIPLLESLKPQEFPAPACMPGQEGPVLLIPLPVQAETVGFICFHSISLDDLDDIQREVLLALGAVCAISVKMITIYEELMLKVAELEETQRRLVERERLAAITKLLGSITHEIKNPLSSAYGLVQLLQEGVEANPDMIRRLERNLSRAKDLVQRLLDYSKPPKPQKVAVEAKALVEDALDFLKGEFKRKKIEVVRRYQTRLMVLADRRQMSDVFMNLLMNAMEAMPAGGTITISTQARKEGMVCIAVRDTGIGIPEDKLSHIFEPFFTTKGKKGTGLGLYNCYNTVRQHNGHIE